MYRGDQDTERKEGERGIFFNVSGSEPAEVSRLSWLCKLPRERWSVEGPKGGWGGEGLRWKRGGRDGCPFSPGGRLMH